MQSNLNYQFFKKMNQETFQRNKNYDKSENCLLALHHINQCVSLSLKNLLTNENDLHNYST